MSGTQNEGTGEWSIDPSELRRVFPWNKVVHEHKSTDVQDEYTPRVEDVMTIKVAMLEEQLQRERETVDDLRKRLDRAEDRMTALTDQRQNSPSRSWLGKLLKL
ncbi:hypothetical protein [Sulfitobacter sp. M23508]|uniref:hypothetical protein n=1 Tax=Sulfitobacter sp. M23508 TaxID=3368577 RepID=UPI0037466AEA